MDDTALVKRLGWLRDLPDFRDFTPEQVDVPDTLKHKGARDSVHKLLGKVEAAVPALTPPAQVDLRPWMSPIEDQGQLGSCTANAGVGLVEYFERKAFGRHTDASRLFLYKATRNLLHSTGDTGAYLRTTMAALALFGAPPEEFWPYKEADFDKEPTAFCYAFGQSFQSVQYYRLDPPGTHHDTLLNRIKTNLAAGLPSMFGFTVYSSVAQADHTGEIPFPVGGERVVGGHAVVAAGYDDTKTVHNTSPGGPASTGAFLIRNSWGTTWGVGGYGWLPYDYVTRGLAVDWWSLIKQEWVDTGQFGLTTMAVHKASKKART